MAGTPTDAAAWLTRDDGFVPKARYLDPEFLALELDHMWSRVWQIACRVEELAEPGDFVVYDIGDQSAIVARDPNGAIHAFHNVCLHRGTRLADGPGSLGTDGTFRCPFHAWRYAPDGRCVEVVDAEDFSSLPDDLRIQPVLVDTWGGFVFVNFDPEAEPLLDYLDPLPSVLAPYHLEQMRLRSTISTVLPANWKALVDAFNEAYHVQGAHHQILPFTDDVSIQYELLGKHAHYGRLAGARRELRPSPRLDLSPDSYDEGEMLANMVGGLGGAFLGEERALVDALREDGPAPGRTMLETYEERRRDLLAARGLDVSGFAPNQMASVDDVFVFPNIVGPMYPGSVLMFRARPANRDDPGHAIHDTWVLEWPPPESEAKPTRRRDIPDWRERDWGILTEQDYNNLERVQRGMHSDAFTGLRLNPRQEINLLHMHRGIDAYLLAGTTGD